MSLLSQFNADMTFCLPKFSADIFLSKLKSGEIDPVKLSEMTSTDRRSFFETFLTKEQAISTNALFESKLLLKNQQLGMINWAKQVSGLKESTRKDIIARINRLSEVLKPEDEAGFLADLAAQKLGFGVTPAEAAHITELAADTTAKKIAFDAEIPSIDGSYTDTQRAYGLARVDFGEYVNGLKNEAKVHTIAGTITEIPGLAKSLKASFDNSAIFRQGWKPLMTNPSIWFKNMKESFVHIAQVIGGKDVMREVNAWIVSRPNYDLYVKAKLAVGTIEEAYPTPQIGKLPLGIGRLYKASETSFTAFNYKVRSMVFDKYIEIAKESGIDITDTIEIQSIGKLVNSLTGRGNLGRLEPAANVVNNIFFSPRFLKSQIDVLTAHSGDMSMTSFARKQAAINLVKIIAGTAAVLTVANAVKPSSVEWDSRSSNFGKIKVGNTRFDVSGGSSSVVTLASRLITWSTKSSITGKISDINTGEFGGSTGGDVLMSFFENKLSPIASVVNDAFLRGQNFQGDKPTISSSLQNLLLPLPISNVISSKDDPHAANMLSIIIADGLGIGANTYSAKTNWTSSTSEELKGFKQKVGPDKFKEANNKYNQAFNEWFTQMNQNPRYQSLPTEMKTKVDNKKKSDLRDEILKSYGYIYKAKSSKIPKF